MDKLLEKMLVNLTEEEKSLVLNNTILRLMDLKADDDKIALTIKEAAKLSGIGFHTLNNEVSNPKTKLPFFKVGTKVLINKKLFLNWLDNISLDHVELNTI